MRELKLGDVGSDVRLWKEFLITLGGQYVNVVVDDTFDVQTQHVTQCFQRSLGVDPTGVVDQVTVGYALLTGYDWSRLHEIFVD